jgi:aryl carrier-like protein
VNTGDYVIVILGALEELGALSDAQARLLEGEDMDLAALGLDSIKVVDFCLLLEQRIGREVAVDELIMNPTVRKLAAHFVQNSE